MKTDNKEMGAYESIIQNLLVLNDEERETKLKEKEAISVILHNISALRDCVCNPDEFLVSNITTCVDSNIN